MDISALQSLLSLQSVSNSLTDKLSTESAASSTSFAQIFQDLLASTGNEATSNLNMESLLSTLTNNQDGSSNLALTTLLNNNSNGIDTSSFLSSNYLNSLLNNNAATATNATTIEGIGSAVNEATNAVVGIDAARNIVSNISMSTYNIKQAMGTYSTVLSNLRDFAGVPTEFPRPDSVNRTI